MLDKMSLTYLFFCFCASLMMILNNDLLHEEIDHAINEYYFDRLKFVSPLLAVAFIRF